MTRIFKYTMEGPISAFDMPGADVLGVGYQDEIVIWARVDTDQPHRRRMFQAFNTGSEVPSSATYVGTVTSTMGYVWHIFETPVRERR